ncbi:hypothetical protein RCL_jg9160.t1 [Rhizophagus clarus]|uniref:Uncharacterized protein n=1 Tax=Rhizophagus clarus TaxID=94130 RepID=A0A8H3R093_9GLOM|nr:hypothetical protein RCL_jg9160.t1 [Rhizophagus clarus]
MTLFLYIDSKLEQLFKIIEDIIERAQRPVVMRHMIAKRFALIDDIEKGFVKAGILLPLKYLKNDYFSQFDLMNHSNYDTSKEFIDSHDLAIS